MFVAGLHILSSGSTCNVDLHTADTLLHKQFPGLYGENKNTPSVHCILSVQATYLQVTTLWYVRTFLLHRGRKMFHDRTPPVTPYRMCEIMGPVRCYSCFPFESRNADLNGYLMDYQICQSKYVRKWVLFIVIIFINALNLHTDLCAHLSKR